MARGSDTITLARDPVEPSWVDSIEDGDEHTAAGLYLRAKRDANDRSMPVGSRQQATRTMQAVRSRFPTAHETAATAADHELGIEGDADLKRVRDQHRAERGVTAGSAASARRGAGGSSSRGGRRQGEAERAAVRAHRLAAQRAGDAHAPARAGGQKRAGGPQPPRGRRRTPARVPRPVRRIGQEAVATSGAGGIADMAIKVLGATIAFAVGYAVLSNAQTAGRGRAAVEIFSKGVTTGIDLFLLPVDPLAPRDQTQRAVKTLARTPSRPVSPTRRTP